jgi:Tol biopolymer transport system component
MTSQPVPRPLRARLLASGVALALAAPAGAISIGVERISNTTAGVGAGLTENEMAISADGRWIAYASGATNIVAGQTDTNANADIFLYDSQTGVTTLVSHVAGSPTTTGNGRSIQPVISADGSRVVFMSQATDLASGQVDGNGQWDVFLYDHGDPTVTLVSHSTTGDQTTADDYSIWGRISADGSWIGFLSEATNLVTGQTDVANGVDLFLYEVASGAKILASHAHGASTTSGCTGAGWFRLSDDGGFVAYECGAGPLLVDGLVDNNGTYDVFLYDRANDTNGLVSHTAADLLTTSSGASELPDISGDGLWVVFESLGSDLVAGSDTNGVEDVFLFSRANQTIALVSHAHDDETRAGDGRSQAPVVNQDGARVAFLSLAGDLVDGANGQAVDQVFLYERSTAVVSMVSHLPGDPLTGGDAASFGLQISVDGNRVAFDSDASDLVCAEDFNGTNDKFVYDLPTDEVTLISHRPNTPHGTGEDYSCCGAMAADGQSLAFLSAATDLVASGSNGSGDAFLATIFAPGVLFTVEPCRVFDSREFPGEPLPSGTPASIFFHGVCGIPDTAAAVAINVTVVEPTGAGHLQLFPADLGPQLTSAVNFSAGQTRADNAIALLATDGLGDLGIQAFVVGNGSVHVVFDVVGWFE